MGFFDDLFSDDNDDKKEKNSFVMFKNEKLSFQVIYSFEKLHNVTKYHLTTLYYII